MNCPRAVVDSTVLISAALLPDAIPARLVAHLLAHGRLLFCDETFAEFETRLWRPKFDRYLSLEDRRALLHDFSAVGEWFKLPSSGARFSRDADDDKFVQLALIGEADMLVSSDTDLLDMPPIAGLRVLKPAAALALFQPE